ncbi:uncharacterized protein CLUP02_08146 [Colletotrichum lupini]|uniref:Uncharacterized protein n=1 Tax=Colletotrichum lupini TaxID=145971 RepID=A0A9Q8WGR7_9PEZI|nr:uncharacterized protein CLUP02_08146 [Colletotrichum lupini]UQC82656.1 hypothetical protein CLUP02_08146 [Colletotrichum lupini]
MPTDVTPKDMSVVTLLLFFFDSRTRRLVSPHLALALALAKACPGPGALCSRHRDSKPTATQPMGPNVSEQCCVWVGPTHGCVDRVVRSPGPVQFRRAEEWESISATAVREKRRQGHLTGAIVVDFDVHAVSQTLLEMLFRPGWGMAHQGPSGPSMRRRSVRGRHIRQCMLLLVAFPALLASLALETDCLLVGTAGWLAYAASVFVLLSLYDNTESPGKTYHHSTTIDRDRVTCFKIGLPLMLIAGKSEERLARYTTGYLSRTGGQLGVFGVAGSGWERQKGAKSTGAPSGHQLDTRACQEIPGSASQRSLNRQPDALGRSKRFRQRGNRGAMAQRALRPNLPNPGMRVATSTLTGVPACCPSPSPSKSLGKSPIHLDPARRDFWRVSVAMPWDCRCMLIAVRWMQPVLEAGIKLQNDPRMPNALARSDDALEQGERRDRKQKSWCLEVGVRRCKIGSDCLLDNGEIGERQFSTVGWFVRTPVRDDIGRTNATQRNSCPTRDLQNKEFAWDNLLIFPLLSRLLHPATSSKHISSAAVTNLGRVKAKGGHTVDQRAATLRDAAAAAAALATRVTVQTLAAARQTAITR